MYKYLSKRKVFIVPMTVVLLLCLLLSGIPFSTHNGIAFAADSVFYDFVNEASKASWESGAGSLPFPGSDNDSRGFALYRDKRQLEDNSTKARALETHPQWVSNGWIMGRYPELTVPADADLKVTVGFFKGATGSDGVTFEVKFEEFLGLTVAPKTYSIVSHVAAYDGKLDSISEDLGSLAGKTGNFILYVNAGQNSGQDWAAWAEAKIEVAAPPALPDLIVEDVWQADNTIRYKIKNVGEGSVVNPPGGTTPFCNALFIDGELVAKDCVNIYEMLPGQSIDNPFDYDWEMTPPEHKIQVCADWDEVVEESNEQNNCWEGVWTMEEEKLPDLVIEEVKCDRENSRIGYMVKNVGDQVVSAGHRTSLTVEGQLIYEDEVDVSLDPGYTYEGYFEDYEWTSSVVLTICADHYDDVGEEDEDNNCRRSECVLEEEGPPPPTELLPDLTVDPYYPVTVGYRTRIAYIGILTRIPIYVTEFGFSYRILNWGAAPAPATWTEIYINGVKVAEQQVEPLDTGERRDEWIPVHWDCELCTEQVTQFQLDAREEIAEESEFNNGRTKTWTCSYLMLPGIDLAAENIRLDPSNSKITYTLSNRGEGESPETDAHLWIDGERVESLHIAPLAAGHSREEHFNYSWQCTHTEDRIMVEVEPVIRVVDDCRGTEIGLGEVDYGNNRAEVTWECEYPDLIIERAWLENGIKYTITNQGRSPSGPSNTKLYCSCGVTSAAASDEVPALEPGESRQGSFPGQPAAYCDLPSEGWKLLCLQADGDDAVIELNDVNNWEQVSVWCGYGVTPGMADLSVERIWFEDSSTVCYEIRNVGGLGVERFCGKPTTKTLIDFSCRCYERGEIREEPDLSSRESRTVCFDVSWLGNWCGCKKLRVIVVADDSRELSDLGSPTANDRLVEEFDNLCADGIQNQGEEGIDCGGPCPASCRDCFADADFGDAEDAGYFCLDWNVVRDTARQALEEYANCLRNNSCRATLQVTDPLMNFSTVTPADLEQSTDYIMEAVAYYVDEHTTYMYDDDDCDICDNSRGWDLGPKGAINAADMILRSPSRSGTVSVGGSEYHVDTCPDGDYCGDCEDHAILREALMRSLGVSWSCAFCADHYGDYWGGRQGDGHTFNLVYYRNKWRIMDYGPLGRYFPIDRYWDAHNPHNVWNDRLGEYWCPDWRSDPACWYCCNHDPYSYTQNYDGGEECYSGDYRTYYEECAP